jgi:hypothetical protein
MKPGRILITMAVLALLAKANLLRSHEVARVQPILDMLDICAR